MNRTEWKFTYTASKLSEAATIKRDEHKKKLEWWDAKKAEVMKKVAETGIEVHDSVAASYSNTKGGFGPQITIDAGLQRDLSEYQSKIMEHNSAVNSFDGWQQVLSANPEARLDLDHEDYLFFFGA